MLCPVCKTQTLQMAERHGIEIDYCPSCRGVWLDRGELDKIIERATDGAGAAMPPPGPAPVQPQAAPPPVMHRDTVISASAMMTTVASTARATRKRRRRASSPSCLISDAAQGRRRMNSRSRLSPTMKSYSPALLQP